jgi:drug/metabolite transporter (DMT)-like permease
MRFILMSFTHLWFVVSESPRFPPNIAIFISIVAVSTASILIRMSAAGPLAIAAYRLTFATLILLPFYIHSGGLGRLLGSSRRDILTLVGVGVVLALHFATWITSLGFTSVASSVVFVHVDPIFVAAVSHFVFKERVNRGTLVGIVVAFAGAIIIAMGDAGVGEVNLYGDLLALVGAIMLGIYILSGRRLRQSLDLVSYVTPVYATSAVALILGSLVTGTKLAPFPMREYLLFLAIAIVPMIFGHTVYNWALRYVEAPVVSISLLGEPVGATVLAYLVLREVPNALALAGGVITLIGIYFCARSSG